MKYEVAVSREGKWWVAEVKGVLGGATEARTLGDLEIEVRDLLAGLLDIEEDSFDLTWDLSALVGAEGQAAWEAFVIEREELDRLRRKLEQDRLTALRALSSAGVGVRDSASLFDLSHQRVAQLLNA